MARTRNATEQTYKEDNKMKNLGVEENKGKNAGDVVGVWLIWAFKLANNRRWCALSEVFKTHIVIINPHQDYSSKKQEQGKVQ